MTTVIVLDDEYKPLYIGQGILTQIIHYNYGWDENKPGRLREMPETKRDWSVAIQGNGPLSPFVDYILDDKHNPVF